MFREKLTNFANKRGYLYIRESYYERDRRTLKRKPAKLCDGTATKERGKYSKKRDIYCGKIQEIEIKIIETFKNYIENHEDIEYLEFKINSRFDELLNSFVEYLLYIYEIDKEDFYEGKKKVYAIGDGYLSRETIGWLKRFNIKGDYDSPKEIERFTYRCEDCGVYDEEVINALYLKLVPQVEKEDILNEFKMLNSEEKTKQYDNYKDFMKKSSK